jgi:hypothetical protein
MYVLECLCVFLFFDKEDFIVGILGKRLKNI